MDKGNGNGNGNGNGSNAGESLFTGPVPGGTDKTTATVLGEIIWLMTQSQAHKQFFISDLEWLVMAPLLLQQFRIYYGADRPVGVLFWGFVDDETQKRLETQAGNAKLRPQDWKSGDNLWVIDTMAPFGGGDEMVKDLKLKVFPDRPIKMLALEDGKLTVREV